MGFQFNGLKAAVTISGTVATGLAQPSSSQAVVSYSGSPVLDTTYQTLITPTATKTFYLTDIILPNTFTLNILLSDNGTQKLLVRSGNVDQPIVISLNTPIPFTTTVQAKVSSGNGTAPMTLVGFEA